MPGRHVVSGNSEMNAVESRAGSEGNRVLRMPRARPAFSNAFTQGAGEGEKDSGAELRHDG